MKVIIPAAGVGAKLRPQTYTQPTPLVPVAGKPIISHIVDFLMEGGIDEFIFITGYMGDRIRKHLEDAYHDCGITMHFLYQEQRLGSAHAILQAKALLNENEELLIFLGDIILDLDLNLFIQAKTSVIGVKKVLKPSLFGIAEVNREGFVQKLIEKPSIPKSNLGLVGIYKISNATKLLAAIQHIIDNDIKSMNEYQLTDALMQMVNEEEKIQIVEVDNWYDCGKKENLLQANALLLNRYDYQSSHEYDNCPNTVLIHPVKIGKNCKIANSIIGPNVVIGSNSSIENCMINNTIIGSFSNLENLILKSSLVGNDASLKGLGQSLNVGDNTQITFHN